MNNDITPEVEAISRLPITGNVIPMSWLKHIRNGRGAADLRLCHMLAEIVYWYRWTEIRDEHSGAVVAYRKKFKSDKLQRSYQEWADLYSITVREAKSELKRLRDMGLITIELRHGLRIATPDGGEAIINNVIYIAPVPDKVAEITELPLVAKSRASSSTQMCTTASTQTGLIYTENNKEINKENNALANASACVPQDAKTQPESTECTESTETATNHECVLRLTPDTGQPESASGIKSRRNGVVNSSRFPDQRECIAALPKELWPKCSEVWREFIGMRYRTGRPICRTSLNDMIAALTGKTPDQAYAIIKYSVLNAYPRLYPDAYKRNGNPNHQRPQSTWQMKRKTELLEHRLQELLDDCPSAIDSDEYKQKQREIAELRRQIDDARKAEYAMLCPNNDECCD